MDKNPFSEFDSPGSRHRYSAGRGDWLSHRPGLANMDRSRCLEQDPVRAGKGRRRIERFGRRVDPDGCHIEFQRSIPM